LSLDFKFSYVRIEQPLQTLGWRQASILELVHSDILVLQEALVVLLDISRHLHGVDGGTAPLLLDVRRET
jgi:hypothetical protein